MLGAWLYGGEQRTTWSASRGVYSLTIFTRNEDCDGELQATQTTTSSELQTKTLGFGRRELNQIQWLKHSGGFVL